MPEESAPRGAASAPHPRHELPPAIPEGEAHTLPFLLDSMVNLFAAMAHGDSVVKTR